MAFKRQNLSFLQREEEQRKEALRQRKAAERQQKRTEQMKIKVVDLERRMIVTEGMLECLKTNMDTEYLTDEEFELYENTLKSICRNVENLKVKLFNMTGKAAYLIGIDGLYAGIN